MVSASDDFEDVLSNESSAVDATASNDFADIQEAVDNAGEGDTIDLNKSYAPSKKELNSDLSVNITKPLNIVGVKGKTVIDAKQSCNFFVVNASEVTIKNIKFTNFANSACVNVYNSDVTFENCIFENNKGEVGTSILALFNQTDHVVNVVNCNFKNNVASGYDVSNGGAIAAVMMNTKSTVNIINSNFNRNSAAKAGAISILSDNRKTSYLNVVNSKFSNNKIIEDDEYYQFSGSDIEILNFEELEALNFELNVRDSSFMHSPRTAKDSAVDSMLIPIKKSNFVNTKFENCIIFTDNGVMKADGCNFSTSYVQTNYNYLAYEEMNGEFPDDYVSNFKVDLSGCEFNHGYLELDGGKIVNSIFSNSQLEKANNYKLNVSNSRFSDDSNCLLEGGNSFFTKCTFKDNPFAIELSKGKLTIADSRFVNNGIDADYKYVNFENTTLKGTVAPVYIKILSGPIKYKSGKSFSFKLFNANTGKILKNYKVTVILYNKNGKKLKTYKNLASNSNGIVYLKGVSSRNVGYYYPVFKSTNQYLDGFELSFAVKKAPTSVKAPKVTNKYKKSKYFKVTVKSYKKPVKSLKLKVKVYTGKKYKTYTIKTNKNGIAKLNTKKLKVGKHKVVISSGNSNYKLSAKSTIVIKR